MNFYYDIKLNFNDELYKFYEWNEFDKLDLLKKIPLIKISSKNFKDIMTSKIRISDKFNDYIRGKSITKDNKKIDACIFCDTKNCIALEFNNDGGEIARSSLLIDDENSICDICYTIKICNLNFTKEEKIEISSTFRQEDIIKKIIIKEINELYDNKDVSKLKYLYYEWFDELEDNIDNIKLKMLNDIGKSVNINHLKIYDIIKLSYNKI